MSEPTPRIRSCTTDTLGGGAEIGVFCDSICATPNEERSKPPQDTASQPVINAFAAIIHNNATP